LDRLRSLDGYNALVASLEADSSSDEEEIHIDVQLGPNGEAQFAELRRDQRRSEKLQKREERRAEKLARREEKFAKRDEMRKEKLEKRQEQQEVKTPAVAPQEPAPSPVVPVVPVPAQVAVPVPAPVVADDPAPFVAQPPPVLSGSSSSIDEFQSKLKTLEEMGFPDRRRNITALVLARGDLVAAVQSLLNQ